MHGIVHGLFPALLLLSAGFPLQAGTLESVRERGTLRCGTTDSGRGLGTLEDTGRWGGFFPDLCRAVAAAVLNDPESVAFANLSTGNRFDALREGAIDVLSQAATWTATRDAGLRLSFVGLAYFDGQGFMVHRATGIHHPVELREARVCVKSSTTTIDNLREFDRRHHLGITVLSFESSDGAYTAFFNRHCLAITDDSSTLASMRQSRAPEPAAYQVLPEVISKEPLGLVVRDDDPAWADIVRWSVLALIEAEELGVRSVDVDHSSTATNSDVRRLLGLEGDLGRALGLDPLWAARAIRAVGHYGELFDRHLGNDSPLRIDRGLNRLWTHGGLLWSPPFR